MVDGSIDDGSKGRKEAVGGCTCLFCFGVAWRPLVLWAMRTCQFDARYQSRPEQSLHIRCGSRPSCRRQSEQASQPWHRRSAGTPAATQAQYQRADRGERVTIDSPKIDGTARPAAGAEDVEPWRAREQRRPDRRRPQHVPAEGELIVPALNDGLRLGTRGPVGGIALEAALAGLLRSVAAPDRWRESVPGFALSLNGSICAPLPMPLRA
jgi:hypothetical protein